MRLVCVCIPFILDARLVDASAGVTQEEGMHACHATYSNLSYPNEVFPFASDVLV